MRETKKKMAFLAKIITNSSLYTCVSGVMVFLYVNSGEMFLDNNMRHGMNTHTEMV